MSDIYQGNSVIVPHLLDAYVVVNDNNKIPFLAWFSILQMTQDIKQQLEQRLGLQCRTPLTQGVGATLAWYREHPFVDQIFHTVKRYVWSR